MTGNRMHNKIERLFSNIFYLLFCAQILSPFIAGRTIYLENIVAVLNPWFVLWIGKKIRSDERIPFIVLGLFLFGLVAEFALMIKMALFVVSVSYIFYSRERGHFYLFRYALVSIFFAIAQFFLLFLHPAWALKIGPASISHLVWGKYATPAFSNFFAILFIPRVSGLSREGGFFASFLVACILVYWLDRGRYVRSKFVVTMLALGLVLSVSKMSLVLIPAFIVVRYSKVWNKIPYFFVPILFSIPFVLFVHTHTQFLTDINGGTFLQRLGGYGAIDDVTWKQAMFGALHVGDIRSRLAAALPYISRGRFDYFTGFPGYLLSYGVAGTLLALIVLWMIGVTPAGLFLLLGMTLNVNIATNQNFVTLTYFIIFAFLTNKYTGLLKKQNRIEHRSVTNPG